MSFDYFVGRLQCSVCNRVSEPDESTGMQTYIRDKPDGALLGRGDKLELDLRKIADGKVDGYFTVSVPASDTEIRILHPWNCPFDGTYNWAEIIVQAGLIESVTAVPLNREVLERSHLISHEAEFVAASLAKLSAAEVVKADTVQILLEKL
jgi:hypothetical protein